MNECDQSFFTPAHLTPLRLDLAALHGGGTAPSQFEGETHDGRPVYCHYRGGVLNVSIGRTAHGDVHSDAVTVLSARLGPPLHGGLSLFQLCTLAGLTIRGKVPDQDDMLEHHSEEDAAQWDDLSGDTTFFDMSFQSTTTTAREALSALCASLPVAQIVEFPWSRQDGPLGAVWRNGLDEVSTSFPCIFAGKRPVETIADLRHSRQLRMAFPDALIFRFKFGGFGYPIRPYHMQPVEDRIRDVGRPYFVAGHEEDCLFAELCISAQFATADSAARASLDRVEAAVRACFPQYETRAFELGAGQPVPKSHRLERLDPVLVAWVKAAPDRWLSTSNQFGDDGQAYLVGRTVV